MNHLLEKIKQKNASGKQLESVLTTIKSLFVFSFTLQYGFNRISFIPSNSCIHNHFLFFEEYQR